MYCCCCCCCSESCCPGLSCYSHCSCCCCCRPTTRSEDARHVPRSSEARHHLSLVTFAVFPLCPSGSGAWLLRRCLMSLPASASPVRTLSCRLACSSCVGQKIREIMLILRLCWPVTINHQASTLQKAFSRKERGDTHRSPGFSWMAHLEQAKQLGWNT